MNLHYEPNFSSLSTELSAEESHHIRTVLRKDEGEILHITNGLGGYFRCRLTGFSGKKIQVQVEEFHQYPQPPQVCLIISVLKTSERMEWLVEKATEIGVTSIVFFISARTERKNLNIEKLNHTAVGAIKQSGRCWLPSISSPKGLGELLKVSIEQKFIATLTGQNTPNLSAILKKGIPACVLIGPEGDFTEEEVTSALKSGFLPARLGDYTLRAETAGLVAVHSMVAAG